MADDDKDRIVADYFLLFLRLLVKVHSKLCEHSRKWHSGVIGNVHFIGPLKIKVREDQRTAILPYSRDCKAIRGHVHIGALMRYLILDSRVLECWSDWSDCPQVVANLMPLMSPAIFPCEYPEFSIRDLWLVFSSLEAHHPEPPVPRARKKLKNQRKCLRRNFTRKRHDACIHGSSSQHFKGIKRGKQAVNNTYNITAKGSAQVVVGDNSRIVNNYYTNDRQDEKAVCSTQGELLIKFLKDYYRRGLRTILLPLPWMEGDQYHIENICTTTKIVKMNTNYVTPLEEIFSKVATDPNNIRRILIEGEPGIGKTAICKKIAYDWSKNNLFPAFEVVLSIKCRDLHTASDLWDAIEMQTFSDCLKEKRTDIFKYIKSKQSKVLVVLDGYDEIPDKCADTMKQSIDRLIRGQLLPDCSVIVTSRPGKGSQIRNHFDRKLEIKGFELNDSFKFIERFFVSSPEDACSLISFIENCEALKDLVRSPSITAILCLVYEEKKHDDSLTLETLCREIVFSLIKRYCTEKGDKEIKDDDIMPEFHDLIYFLGKHAFNVIKENRCGIDEKEFAGVASAQFLGFLVKRNSLNKIRQEKSYYFLHDSIKEYLAVYYIEFSIQSCSDWKQ